MSTISPETKRILRTQPCYYCGKPSENIDHMLPSSRGGSDGLYNLVGSCKTCNEIKSSMTVDEFREATIGKHLLSMLPALPIVNMVNLLNQALFYGERYPEKVKRFITTPQRTTNDIKQI